MKKNNLLKFSPIAIIFLMLMMPFKVSSQAATGDEMNSSNLKAQFDYLEAKTRIYENYRAIREDMFQRIKKNVTDTLNVSEKKIAGLNSKVFSLNRGIDSLQNLIQTTKSGLDEMTRTKNSIKVLGMNVNKNTYNGIIWTIIAGLLLILILGFIIFKRNQMITLTTQKELKNLRDEFEEYRKTTRIAREKMTMDHFNEIKKLRGG
jgi:hypothetical protein